MFAIPEQFSHATKASFEAQFAAFTNLTAKAFEGMEKLVDLNLAATRANLEESAQAARQLLAVKDPQEFLNISQAQAKPVAEKALAYSRQLANIASSTQNEFSKAAEAQITETNRKVIALVDEVSKNAPAGSETAIAALKSVIGNANAGFEQLSKAGKQALDAIEANLSTVVNQYAQAAEKVAPRTSKK
ncbi:MAG: TIGR01841 family phasin [Burkholderiales bacterium]|nr:TIGR01841 family phasin [Burkholderiales bacterium]